MITFINLAKFILINKKNRLKYCNPLSLSFCNSKSNSKTSQSWNIEIFNITSILKYLFVKKKYQKYRKLKRHFVCFQHAFFVYFYLCCILSLFESFAAHNFFALCFMYLFHSEFWRRVKSYENILQEVLINILVVMQIWREMF